MATPPDSFYARQEAELQALANARVAEIMRLIEFARRDIHGRIVVSELEYKRLLALNAQLDEISRQLQRDLSQVAPVSGKLAEMVARHQTASISAITGRESITIAYDTLNTSVVKAFAANEMAKVTSITAVEEIRTIKAVLFSRVGVQGLNPTQVARELAGPNGIFTRRYGLVENILRTEASTIYNEQSLNAIQQANDTYDAGLNKKILETIDDKRNHPISQVLNGQVQPVDRPFKAAVADVESVAARLKRSGKGVFWPVIKGYYTGQRLPAHYRERGVVIATDEPPNGPK
jgi:hypothetical protein